MGSSPPRTTRGRRHEASGRRRPDPRVVYQVASWCLDYPTMSLVERLPLFVDALAEQPHSPAVRRASTAWSSTSPAPPWTTYSTHTSTSSTSVASTPCICRTGPMATPAAAVRCWPVQVGLPGQRLPRGHARRAARLPADGPRVRGRADPAAGRGLLRDYRASLELLRIALLERQSPRMRVGSSRSVRRCRASRRRAGPPSKPWSTPDRRASPSASTPTTRGCSRCSGPVSADGRPALGSPALRRHRRPRGRDGVALPLRQVRLDHPLVPALRVAAAADRLAALPLRDPVRASSVTSADSSSRSRGRRRSGSARALPLQRPALRWRSRACARWSASSILDLPDGAPPARCSWRPPATTSSMYVVLVGAIVLGLWTTLVSVRRRLRGAQLPRDGLAVVPLAVRPAARCRGHGRGAHPVPHPRPGRHGAVHIWPFTRLVHAFTAPVHYLFRPYIVYRSRDRAATGARPSAQRAGPDRHPATATVADPPTEETPMSQPTDRVHTVVDLRARPRTWSLPRLPSRSPSGPGT